MVQPSPNTNTYCDYLKWSAHNHNMLIARRWVFSHSWWPICLSYVCVKQFIRATLSTKYFQLFHLLNGQWKRHGWRMMRRNWLLQCQCHSHDSNFHIVFIDEFALTAQEFQVDFLIVIASLLCVMAHSNWS